MAAVLKEASRQRKSEEMGFLMTQGGKLLGRFGEALKNGYEFST